MSGNLFRCCIIVVFDIELAQMCPRPSTMTEKSNERIVHSLEGPSAFVARRLKFVAEHVKWL